MFNSLLYLEQDINDLFNNKNEYYCEAHADPKNYNQSPIQYKHTLIQKDTTQSKRKGLKTIDNNKLQPRDQYLVQLTNTEKEKKQTIFKNSFCDKTLPIQKKFIFFLQKDEKRLKEMIEYRDIFIEENKTAIKNEKYLILTNDKCVLKFQDYTFNSDNKSIKCANLINLQLDLIFLERINFLSRYVNVFIYSENQGDVEYINHIIQMEYPSATPQLWIQKNERFMEKFYDDYKFRNYLQNFYEIIDPPQEYNHEEVNKYIQNLKKQIQNYDCNFGGLDFIYFNQPQRDTQTLQKEQNYLPHLQFYVTLGLNLLANEGTMIVKLNGLFLTETLIMVYILYQSFQSIYLVKPQSSIMTSPEIFLICHKNKSEISSILGQKLLSNFDQIFRNNQLPFDIKTITQDVTFFLPFERFCKKILANQIKYIETLNEQNILNQFQYENKEYILKNLRKWRLPFDSQLLDVPIQEEDNNPMEIENNKRDDKVQPDKQEKYNPNVIHNEEETKICEVDLDTLNLNSKTKVQEKIKVNNKVKIPTKEPDKKPNALDIFSKFNTEKEQKIKQKIQEKKKKKFE